MSNPDDNKELVEIVAMTAYYAEDMGERPEWEREPPTVQERYRRTARAVLDVIEASGRKIVPVEPTEAMWVAGTESLRLVLTSADSIYRSMLSASPKVTDRAALSQTDTAEERR